MSLHQRLPDHFNRDLAWPDAAGCLGADEVRVWVNCYFGGGRTVPKGMRKT